MNQHQTSPSLPIVRMRLPRLKKSCGRIFILHPSAFILPILPVAESMRYDRLQLRGQCRFFTVFPRLPFMVDGLPEHFMHRRNSRHPRDWMCIDKHLDCKDLLE